MSQNIGQNWEKSIITGLLLLCYFCIHSAATAATAIATLQINFPGLTSVHTEVRVADGVNNTATGASIKKANWKNDSVAIEVTPGVYDLIIRRGAGTLIIDDVDCTSGSCTVNNVAATLTVNFAGLNSVHTSVRVLDSVAGQASGGEVIHKNWQNDSAEISVLRQVVDLLIRKGGGQLIVDNVDCRSGTCSVNDITATLTVDFPGLSSVHTSVHVPDNTLDSASGDQITDKNWQQNQAVITILRQIVDLKIRKQAETVYVDNVDCSSGVCSVDNLTATLTVNFLGLSSVHTSVRLPDNIAGEATAEEVTNKNWQNDRAVITVFRKTYDLLLRKGAGSLVIDRVDCASGSCVVNDAVANLTVHFPGLSSVHTSVRMTDGSKNSASGEEVTNKNWQNEQAVIPVFPGIYDLSISKGGDSIVIDDVNCTTGTCSVDNITATLSVNFPGLANVHSSVYRDDGQSGSASGAEVTKQNWKTDQAVMTVLRQVYDVAVRHGKSEPTIIDSLDCTSGSCLVDNITAKLTVNFPGLNSIHTSVRTPDNKQNSAEGVEVVNQNWKTDQAVITVLRQVYDVSVRRKNSTPLIIDKLDCTSGTCLIDDIIATMTVDFAGMSNVHSSVHVPDAKAGTADGEEFSHLNWQKDQAVITVFKQLYDVKVRLNNSQPMIIDQLDCTSGTCRVDQITAVMTVDFPELKSVHTSVHVPDSTEGAAEGAELTHLNWQTDQAVITVFKQVYDVKVRKGPIAKIIDKVDCTSGNCLIDELTATLLVEFPGLRSVHSSAHVPDALANTADGELAANSNWKSNQTTITLLRQIYDVKVKHAITSVFDDVDCSGEQCNVLVTGNVQALLIDGDLNTPLSEKDLIAYEKMPDGSLTKVMQGKTTEKGQVNFTLEGITAGRVYVLKTYNPFGNSKPYYSPVITQEGEFKFIITVDGANTLDQEPPKVSISSPQQGGNVPASGFNVTGIAQDNREIDRVTLRIEDPDKGSNELNAVYDATSGGWSAAVPATLVTLGKQVALTATAFDLAQNRQTTSVTVTVVEDNEGPEITFISHNDDDQVSETGFLLSGSVIDLTGVATLKATLQTVPAPGSERTLFAGRDVDFAGNGSWTLVIDNGLINAGDTVRITLDATDTLANAAAKTITLRAVAADYSGLHLLNRITFGATPALLQELNTLGTSGLLNQQLNPAAIDDSNFAALLAGSNPGSKQQLQAWTLLHMLYSKRQLLELMTWFWDNHFNTDINTIRNNANGVPMSDTVAYELAENQAFRANALGNFRDLLEISAKSPSMLIYLDSISNVVNDSNENYARELLELHTMSVDGGYTHHDIEAGAEIFTGWHLQNGAFFFNGAQHTSGSYSIFADTIAGGISIPDGGVEQGELFLDAVATHPSTANFICRKLIRVFVSDMPPATLVGRCAQTFLSTSADADQIKQVLNLILNSAEFYAPAYYRGKIKTPVEFVVGALRNLDADSTGADLAAPISAMGMRLYENPLPTGWSEIGSDWINSSLLIERIKWVNDFVRNPTGGNNSSSEPLQFYPLNGFATADGIVGFALQLTIGDDATVLARQQALQLLGNNFELTQPNAGALLRQMNGVIMSYPQYQFQ